MVFGEQNIATDWELAADARRRHYGKRIRQVHRKTLTPSSQLCGTWAGDKSAWADSGCPGTCEDTIMKASK